MASFASLDKLLRLSSDDFAVISHDIQRVLAPADGSELAAALAALTGFCQRPPDIAEDALRDWMSGLMVALQRHPAAVALAAVQAWPQQPGGRWWPMAADLDAIARSIGADHAELADRLAAARAARRTKTTPERSNNPIGRSAQFVERVRVILGAKYVKSWLVGGVNAQFGDTVVWLTPFGAQVLRRDCGEIAKTVGVLLEADPDLSVTLAQYCEARGLAV